MSPPTYRRRALLDLDAPPPSPLGSETVGGSNHHRRDDNNNRSPPESETLGSNNRSKIILVLGTSMTLGRTCSPTLAKQCAWPARLGRWLARTYDGADRSGGGGGATTNASSWVAGSSSSAASAASAAAPPQSTFEIVNLARGATSSDAAARSIVPLLARGDLGVDLARVALVLLDFVVVDGNRMRMRGDAAEAHGSETRRRWLPCPRWWLRARR